MIVRFLLWLPASLFATAIVAATLLVVAAFGWAELLIISILKG